MCYVLMCDVLCAAYVLCAIELYIEIYVSRHITGAWWESFQLGQSRVTTFRLHRHDMRVTTTSVLTPVRKFWKTN